MDQQQAAGKGYPFEWRGKTYYLSPLTLEIMAGFIAWLKRTLLDEARKYLPADEYDSLRTRVLVQKIAWNTQHVADALSTVDGSSEYLRLLLGEQAKGWTNQDLQDLQQDKALEAARTGRKSDLALAIEMLREDATPKAGQPTTGG
ncbi:hypothetical protein EBZ38_08925 [bacterium]|nr:hypothetical protein [Betaproteobacteria bacterium]NDC94683.1 hypothetical protein [bacterium]NDD84377.1 hypothetical protein [bacterium]NDG19017.1 hypothetical protein [Betaproteobacteria bacterium]